MTNSPAAYWIDVPGLAEAIGKARPSEDHQALTHAIGQFDALSGAKLGAIRDGYWRDRRKVVDPTGKIVGEDLKIWLALQIQADGGNVGRTYERLKGAGYKLTKCEITKLYLAHDRQTANAAELVQVEVDLVEEFIDRELFSQWQPYRPLLTLDDLLHHDGDVLSYRPRLEPTTYALRCCIDIAAFVDLSDSLEAQRRQVVGQRQYRVTGPEGSTIQTHTQLHPDWDRYPHHNRRFFKDWQRSSAGREGIRIGQHWSFDVRAGEDQKGEQWTQFVPMWNFRNKLAKIEASKHSDYALYGKLEAFDRRIKVPFGWFFYMLHGNRINADVGDRVISMAENGKIVLPEHDYRVLKDWSIQPYAF